MDDRQAFLRFIESWCENYNQQPLLDFYLRLSAPNEENISFFGIAQAVQRCTDEQIDILLKRTKSDFEELPSSPRFELEWLFEVGYRAWVAYTIFQTFSMEQLSKVLPAVPFERSECLHSLEKTQELLSNIDLNVLLNLQSEINMNAEGILFYYSTQYARFT